MKAAVVTAGSRHRKWPGLTPLPWSPAGDTLVARDLPLELLRNHLPGKGPGPAFAAQHSGAG